MASFTPFSVQISTHDKTSHKLGTWTPRHWWIWSDKPVLCEFRTGHKLHRNSLVFAEIRVDPSPKKLQNWSSPVYHFGSWLRFYAARSMILYKFGMSNADCSERMTNQMSFKALISLWVSSCQVCGAFSARVSWHGSSFEAFPYSVNSQGWETMLQKSCESIESGREIN